MKEFSDTELSEFCSWFKDHFEKVEAYECVFVVSMSGHFHTIPRNANKLLERCKKLDLIETKWNVVYLK
jgi:hypothetical protein